MYIKNHYYNTQISSLKNQHAIQWTTGGSEISHLSVGGTYWEATVDHQRTHEGEEETELSTRGSCSGTLRFC